MQQDLNPPVTDIKLKTAGDLIAEHLATIATYFLGDVKIALVVKCTEIENADLFMSNGEPAEIIETIQKLATGENSTIHKASRN